jgi:uroporphyrinogen-III synthase
MQAVAGRRVAIFRGDGGRELLGDTLRARGAVVEYVESYRRALPQADAAPLLKEWAGGDIDAVTVTSSEGLRNLCVLVGTTGLEHLKRTPLFVPHPRIELAAKDAGCTHIVVTQQGDDGLIAGLAAWFGSAHLHD